MGQDPRIIEVYVKGLGQSTAMSDIERLQFDFLVMTLIRKLENAFTQYQSGTVTESEWRSWNVPIQIILASPGGKRWWSEWSPQLGATFRSHVAAELTSPIPPNPEHPVARAVRDHMANA